MLTKLRPCNRPVRHFAICFVNPLRVDDSWFRTIFTFHPFKIEILKLFIILQKYGMICCRVVRFLLFLIGWRIELLDSFVDSFIKNLMIEMWQGKNIRREHVILIDNREKENIE